MLQGNLLDDRSHLGHFFRRSLLFQRSIETSATDRNQLAHALDTQAALQKYYFSDLLVDAVPPVSSRFWRRASTFCKAGSKISRSSWGCSLRIRKFDPVAKASEFTDHPGSALV